MQAIGYRRVSTAGQIEGEGLGVQADKIEAWCRYQQIDLVESFEDAGVSGATLDRPALRGALTKAFELGKEAVLVVAKLDRLGRNSIEVQTVLKQLTDAGVRVVAIGDGLDSASGMGTSILKLLVSILASFGELEREVIKVRLLDGRRRAKTGKRVYSSEPQFGLEVANDGRSLVDSKTELAAIQRALALRTKSNSYRVIATTLDQEGYRPRRASRWQAAVVRRMIIRAQVPKVDQAA